jgi:hypothetical protein
MRSTGCGECRAASAALCGSPLSMQDNHVKHFKDAPEGIKVVGADGKALPAVRDVLKICAAQKLVVHTGHLSPSEALAVIEAGRDMGVERMVVTHAQFEVVKGRDHRNCAGLDRVPGRGLAGMAIRSWYHHRAAISLNPQGWQAWPSTRRPERRRHCQITC